MSIRRTGRAPWLLATAVLAAGWTHGAAAQELMHALQTKVGGRISDWFASTVAVLSDLDGDGVAEIATGSSRERGGRGRVHVFSGRSGALLWTFVGDPKARVGRSMASLDDFDGDGIPDVLASGSQRPENGREGKAYVVSGADGSVLLALDGEPRSLFGWRSAALGDVDGDGSSDFAVGAPATDGPEESEAGKVYVYSGASGALLYSVGGRFEDQRFGRAVAAAGDVDGDGRGDLLVGSRGDARGESPGRVDLLSGATGETILTLEGGTPSGRHFGDALAGGVDVDGDAVPDFLVGDPVHEEIEFSRGAAFLYSGATGVLLREWRGEHPDQQLGIDVAFAGDVNGDGVADVLLGQDLAGSEGLAHLHSGRDGRWLYRLAGGTAGDNGFGAAVAGGADLDGDGLCEVVVGAPRDSSLRDEAGRAFVYRGSELYLEAQPRRAAPGVALLLGTRAREPLALSLLAVVAIDGAAAWLVLDAGRVDDDGRRRLSGTVPPGLSGLTIGFQAFALDSRAGVVDSAIERVEFL